LRDSTILGGSPLRSSVVVEMNGNGKRNDMPDLESESERGTDRRDSEEGGAVRITGSSNNNTDGVKLLSTHTQDPSRPIVIEEKIREVSPEEIARLRLFLAESAMMTTEQAEGIPIDVLTDLTAEGVNLEETFAVCRELHAQGVRLEKMRPPGEPSNPKRVKTTYTRTYRVVRQKSVHKEEESARPLSNSGAKRLIKKPPPVSPTLSPPSEVDDETPSIFSNED